MFKSVKLVDKPAAGAVIVRALFKDRTLDSAARAADTDGAMAEAVKRPECTGEAGTIVESFGATTGARRGRRSAGQARTILVGLGDRGTFKAGSLRAVAATVARRLAATKETGATIELAGALSQVRRLDMTFAGRCLGEGFGLIAWNFDGLKGTGSATPNRQPLSISCADPALRAGLATGLSLAQSTNVARDVSQTPPNIANTDFIVSYARRLAREGGLSCRIFAGAELDKERFTGLVNVGKASESKPCLIRLEYSPRGKAKSGRPLVLVGKTMTYDTGGLSLKINNGMVGMKRDKDGGCAVLGAMHAIAHHVRPNRRVVALLACAENSISDNAYRPDDVIRFRNGVTVEVTNTDAEGRLVLADALCWACEKEDPECVVDIATLTGGVVTALGDTFAGMFCEDAGLRARLDRAMESSGERFWRLPMDPEYRDMMKSPIADILNSNPNRKAHPIQGAAFLSYFVKNDVPWAHLDIAGVHAVESDKGPFCKGPTGWGVRLLADLASAY